MADAMTEITEALRTTKLETPPSPTQTVQLLDKITQTDPALLQNLNLAADFVYLLAHTSIEIKIKVAKCIADITKTDSQRKFFTEPIVMAALIDGISIIKVDTNLEFVIQICRALGNIFYQNDDARDILLQFNGDDVLIKLLDVTRSKITCDDESWIQFVSVRCGLISNYLVGGETVAKRAMDLNIMQKLEALVEECAINVEQNEDLLLNILPPLSILTETVADLNFVPSLNRHLVKVLAESKNPDIAEICLDLLHYQAENDDVKLLLAKEGLCETIYKLLEKYKTLANTSEARALMKLACEIVVLILTGDESMKYLYSTPLIKYIEDWLDSYDIDLLTTGVLALGNFARTDSHCIYMVENNIMKKLLEILSKNNGIDDDIRLQHALLSTLRNLVIPKPNKLAIIEAGLVQTILPMLEIHQAQVVFKLLGTLRMTVDGQEQLATELLQNRTLITQLVHWSKSSEYANITGESLRLMAWIIKHAYYYNKESGATNQQKTPMGDQSLRAFVRTSGAVECMVTMLTAQHLVMQNEALIALSIMTAVIGLKGGDSDDRSNSDDTEPPITVNLNELFISCDLGRHLSEFITKKSDTMSKEIVENVQTFMGLLRVSDSLIEHLNKYNIDELLKSIPILTEYCTL